MAGFGHSVKSIDGYLKPLGYFQMTSLATSKGFADASITIPPKAKLVILQAETQNVRWRDDGTDPTASVGHIIEAAGVFFYNGNFEEIEFIEVAASAKLNVSFYG